MPWIYVANTSIPCLSCAKVVFWRREDGVSQEGGLIQGVVVRN